MKNYTHWKAFVLLLNEAAKQKGITQTQIAEKTGISQPHVSRFFALNTCPTLHTFIEVSRAIGINFFFEDKEGSTDLSELFERAMTELGRKPDKLQTN